MLAARGHFVLSRPEAEKREVKQIGVSACGATAILNALIALKWENLPSNDEADRAVGTRLRKLKSPLQEYLLSRSDAGATHEDLIKGMEILTNGKVIGRFFHMFPKTPPNLFEWMSTWMQMGGALVASLNLQRGVASGSPIPDAWHHQMIYGVIQTGVYTLNPNEFIPFPTLAKQLTSESTIKIQAQDIVKRWQPDCDFSKLSEGRWAEMKVVSSIEQLLHSVVTNNRYDSHVAIPATYKSGVTVFCTTDSDAGRTLLGKQ